MNKQFSLSSSLLGIAMLYLLASPCNADLFAVAIEVNDNISNCEWLYRDVHEWARENGGVGGFLTKEKAAEVKEIKSNMERIDREIVEDEEQATPATFAATAAFAAAQHNICRAALEPGSGTEGYAGSVERELAKLGSLRSDVEAAFGRSLTFSQKTDPKVYAEKKAAWEAIQKEKEATERKRRKDHQAAIDQWEKDRRVQQKERENRSKERQMEMMSAAEKEQQEEAAKQAQGRAELNTRMQAWHSDYKASVAGVKSSLGQVLAAMKANDSTSLVQSCRQLQLEVKSLERKSGVFDSPDSISGKQLEAGYRHLRSLSANCMQGRMTKTQGELDSIKEKLGKAAKTLAEYGLRP